jgi:hypothetical protein
MSLTELRDKLHRADQHIEHLKQFLPSIGPSEIPGDLATVEPQGDGQSLDVFFKGIGPLSLDLRIAIGRVVHEYRTCLDHLTYQIALRNKFPATAAARTPKQSQLLRKLSFLIHDTPERFKSSAGNVKQIIGSFPVAEMEKLQPYKGADWRAPILWTLSELDNITKHRIIVAVDPRAKAADLTFKIGDKSYTGVLSLDVSTKDRAKLFNFRLPPTPLGQPPPKVDMHIQTTNEIVFADTDGLCDGANIFDVMRKSSRAVTSVIDDFEKLFF